MAVRINQRVFKKEEVKLVQYEKWGGFFPIDNYEDLTIEDNSIVFITNGIEASLNREAVTIEFMPGVNAINLKAIKDA